MRKRVYMKEVKVVYTTNVHRTHSEQYTIKTTTTKTDTSEYVHQTHIKIIKVTYSTPPKFIFKNKKPIIKSIVWPKVNWYSTDPLQFSRSIIYNIDTF